MSKPLPRVEIDPVKLKALMRLKPTLADTAAFFECSERTVERYVKEEFSMTFRDFCEAYMVHTRLNLIRKAIDKAEKGDNVMLIFCLKNLCGWENEPNKQALAASPGQAVTLTNEQLTSLVKAARGLKAI